MLATLASCQPAEEDADAVPAAAVVCDGDEEVGASFEVSPFVQSVTPTSAWIVWETDVGVGSRLEYGPTEALGKVACGSRVPVFAGGNPDTDATQVHEAELSGQAPDSDVYYRVVTGDLASEVARFRTAPDAGDFTRLLAMSDSQQDDARPEQWRDVVEKAVLPYLRDTTGHDHPADAADLVVMPGDLVDEGWDHEEWASTFFAGGAPLFASVPLYPAIGNHEGNSPLYFRYFHLPEDGQGEHWYTTDRNNLRLIALDSNAPYDGDEQLEWLDAELDRACDDDAVDFVFAELHHPYKSELWPEGESPFTGEVIARLDAFSTGCGKPAVHFFGHTHGYSRGQSSDHRHLWVNVASAGGALDRWGSPTQVDYPEFSISEDAYGFVEVEVTAGQAPSLTLRRLSLGNPDAPLDRLVTDAITVYRYDEPPVKPQPTSATAFSACDGAPVLRASAYSDPEGHAHTASGWEVAATCDGFDAPLATRWRQSHNFWGEVDLQAGDDLTDEPFAELLTVASACWRVRYRDEGLAWSEYSEPVKVTVEPCP